MNEEANTETVKKAYQKFGSGDIQGLLTLFADNIKWTIPNIENAPFSGTRSGIPAVQEFFAQLSEAEDISLFEPSDFIAQGDKVVVLGRSIATPRSTGNSYETDWVHVFTLESGKITNFVEFFDNAAATKAFQKSAAAN
jgi:ketosteroid isomerase-like protein